MISDTILKNQLKFNLEKTDFNLGKKYEGKVRDNYLLGDKRVIITTDRISAFDRVLCTLPFKGQVLNQTAAFWFDKTKHIAANHIISVPDPNAVVAKECKPYPVEMVVRGYLTGVTTTSAWYNYENGVRNFCGNILPDGMKKNQKFDTPILTPSTKAEKGDHDESISPDELIERGIITEDLWDKLADISLKLFQRGVEICAKQGIILVDTKYEFGFDENGDLTLIDEIHTPDSSRFWFESEYEIRFMEGIEQKKIDKEYLREWLAERGFRGEGESPMIPGEGRAETARRYIEAYKLITGQSFDGNVGDVTARIKENLRI